MEVRYHLLCKLLERGGVIVSKMYNSIIKGLEEAINDVNETIKLERHTVEDKALKIHPTKAPGALTVPLIEKEKQKE